ncbi:MAG: hypothetical protein J6Y77_01940 [Paludibacteraceae bacterium]|nr:hypothetical protein [Paludibacteraceae bacterium]
MNNMNTRRLFAGFGVLLCCLTAWAADETISRDVTVEKDYAPTEIDANKINLVPEKEEYHPEKPIVTYSTWTNSQDVSTSPAKVRADRFRTPNESEAKDGVFKVGVGHPIRVLGEFYYPLLQGDSYLLDINLGHHSDWNHIRLEDDTRPRAAQHTSDAALTFEKQFKDTRLATALDFRYGGYDFYGLSTDSLDMFKDTMSNFTRVGLSFDLFSTNAKKAFQYDFLLDYHYFNRRFDVNSNDILLQGTMAGTVGDGQLGTDLRVKTNILGGNAFVKTGTSCLFELEPFYKFSGKNWDLRIGANLFVFGTDSTRFAGDSTYRKRPVTGSANIQGQFGLIPELFYLVAGIGGEFDDNSYTDVIDENRYLRADRCVRPSYTPLSSTLGLKIKIMDGFLFDVSGNYSLIKDEHFFVNYASSDSLYTNTFEPVYAKTTHLVRVKAGLHFDAVKGLDASVNAQYNLWGLSKADKEAGLEAWHRPMWEIRVKASYEFLKKWKIGASYEFLGGRKALVLGEKKTLANVHDVNLFASYKALDWLTVYLDMKNLANVHSDSWYGYRNMGINFLAGAIFSF